MPAMTVPPNAVKIRMYRQGHGDCFLLAFPRDDGSDRPVFMLIDFGYKPGSQITRKRRKVDANRVAKDIAEATDENIDIVVVTHEHQDHVNALTKLKGFTFGEAWFAWTESPKDPDAIALRKRHKDQLIGLLGARNQLSAMAGDNADAKESVARLDALLSLELGDDGEDEGVTNDVVVGDADALSMFGASGDPSKSKNKKAMAFVKEAAGQRLRFLLPHDGPEELKDAAGIRIYPLGPPKGEELLRDEDPDGLEGFPGHGATTLSFFAAASDGTNIDTRSLPFDSTFVASDIAFFERYYGPEETASAKKSKIVPDAAAWRRIDEEWLYAAESFALKLNRGINNTSLVLAIELPQTKKVLLFVGDAQAGNWKSWDDGSFEVEGRQVTARDLLARTVVYKTGHHGSHNATLNDGAVTDDYDYPNLSWMGHGKYGSEFTAFVTAHRHWAINKAKWDHPLKSIKDALIQKANGRVFQTDEDKPSKPDGVSDASWKAFMSPERVTCDDLYFDYVVFDED